MQPRSTSPATVDQIVAQDLEDDDGDVVVGIEAEALVEEASDTAGAHDAEDRRDAHVQFERVEPLVREQRQRLRKRERAVQLELRGARCVSRLEVGVLVGVDRLGDELHDDAEIEEEQGDETRQRAHSRQGHEDRRVDEVGHRADHVDDGAHDPARDRVRVRRPRGPQRQRHRHGRRECGANDRHLDGLEHRDPRARQEREIGLRELRELRRAVPPVLRDGREVEVDSADGGQAGQHREGHEGDHDEKRPRPRPRLRGQGESRDAGARLARRRHRRCASLLRLARRVPASLLATLRH
jgi:hypothetical protein